MLPMLSPVMGAALGVAPGAALRAALRAGGGRVLPEGAAMLVRLKTLFEKGSVRVMSVKGGIPREMG